jgi:hypothetical protein
MAQLQTPEFSLILVYHLPLNKDCSAFPIQILYQEMTATHHTFLWVMLRFHFAFG